MLEGYDPVLIGAIAGMLVLFGILYNIIVTWLEDRGYDEGYTAPMVVVGVLATLGAVALLDPRAAALALGAFVLTGTPMILGSWWRHVTARERGKQNQRREALHGHKSQTLAE